MQIRIQLLRIRSLIKGSESEGCRIHNVCLEQPESTGFLPYGPRTVYGIINIGDPINWIDIDGLARSGQTTAIGQFDVRVDKPHVPGQQTHAHISGGNIKGQTVVNIDETPSHGSICKVPKSKKLLKFLRGKGFQLQLSIIGFTIGLAEGDSMGNIIGDIISAPIWGVSEAE